MTLDPTTPRIPLRAALFALIGTVLALGGGSVASAQVVIDEFATSQGVITAPPGGSSNATTAGADIVGQNRNLTVLLVEGAGPATAEVTGGALEVAIADTTPDSRGDVLLVWDGGDHTSFDPTGLLGVDLTAGGTGGLRFDIAEAPAGTSLVVTIYEDGSNVSRAGRVLPAIAAPASLYIDWSELVAAPDAVGPADLTNVGAITLQLSGTETPLLAITHLAAVAPQVAASKVDRTAAGAAIAPAGVNPGDQVRYRVTVTNPGAGAEGVDFDDTVDANTAIVGGSVRTTPLARRDHYATITGVVFDSVLESAATLLANDLDPDGDSLVAVVATGQATTQGGTVDIDAAGDFVYTPPAGFQGVDSFTYELDATAGDPTVDAAGSPIGAITGRVYVIIDRVAPALAGAGTVVFTEDGPAVAVAPALTVSDDDSPNLASATVTLTTVLDGADEMLTTTSCGGLTVGGSGTSALTISGSATLAAYQTCLRSVRYENADQDPNGSDRMVEFQVSDGLLLSNVETATVEVVPVNDAPVVTTSGGTSGFTEDGGAIVVDGGLTVTDVDDANIQSAMVVITNVLDIGFESLAATACGGLTVSGTTTLSISGSASKAAYETCLRSVTYNNTDQDPNATNRSISFKVNDGDVDSDLAFKTVTVTPVNDLIVFTTNPITYTTPGNTQLHVAGRTTPGVAAHTDAQNVLTKSGPTDVDGPMAAMAVPYSGATPNGFIDIIASGAFHYVPNVGFTGTDTFSVQITDGADAVNLTINMTVAQTVWYVCNETAADACVTGGVNVAGGDGRSTNAFETLTAAAAASVTPDDYIFVFEGNTVASPLTGGVALEDGEKLHGEGIGLTVTGFPQLVPAGNRPRIRTTTASTDVVSVPATATKRENVEIRGLDLEATGTTSNAIDVTSSGALNLIVRISENTIRGATAEGLDVNAGSTSTTQRLAIHDNSLTAGGTALDVTRTNGTVTITAFDDNVVTGNSNGAGIVVTGPVTFDATPGGALDAVSGGTTAIGASGNPITGAGLTLASVTGALDFTDLDVFAGTSGVALSGTGTFTGAAGTRVTVPNGVAIIEAANGPGVSASTMTLDFRLNALTVSASGSTGVNLVDVSDATVVPAASHFSAPSSATIASTTGTAFNVDGGNATISYAGSINNTSGRSVSVQNRTADTTTFTGGITDTGTGILVNANNVASTTSFQGGLNLSTGTSAAFTATSGGTLTVCDENPCNPGATGLLVNTLTTTTGTALNVTSTTIGANNLEFRSISSNGGGNVGIALNNTGATGGLRVKGNGGSCTSAGTCTGGAIQNKSVAGVSLITTRDVSLSHMFLDNNDGSGVLGSGVTGFSILNSTVTNNDDGVADGNQAGLRFTNLHGVSVITSTTFQGQSEDHVRVLNDTTGTPNLNLTVSTSTFNINSAVTGGHAVALLGTNTANMTLNVTGSSFDDIRSTGVIMNVSDTARGTYTVSGNQFRDIGVATTLGTSGSADLIFSILNNTEMLRSPSSNMIQLVAGSNSTNASQIRGTISGNVIGNGTVDSGTGTALPVAYGIAIDLRGDQDSIIEISNNTTRNTEWEGIWYSAADFGGNAAQSPTSDLILRDNSVVSIDDNDPFPRNDIRGVLVDFRHTTTGCLDIAGNSSVGSAGFEHFRVRQRDTSVVRLERFSDGDGTPNELINNVATVEAFLVGQNDPGSTADATLSLGFTEAADNSCRPVSTPVS